MSSAWNPQRDPASQPLSLRDRFDVDDRKGLEIVILTALLTFSDANDASHLSEPPTLNKALSRNASQAPTVNDMPPPPPPPKPAPKTGVDRIAEMQAAKGEYNELIISDEGSVADYAQYCNSLLQVCWIGRLTCWNLQVWGL